MPFPGQGWRSHGAAGTARTRLWHGSHTDNHAKEHSAPLLFSRHGYRPVRIVLPGIPGNMKIVKYSGFI